jgi:hypothetical protein
MNTIIWLGVLSIGTVLMGIGMILMGIHLGRLRDYIATIEAGQK